MKFSQNGYDFTTEEGPAVTLNEYANHKKVKLISFLTTNQKNGVKTIVLFDVNGNPIKESQRMEDIACYIDAMTLLEEPC